MISALLFTFGVALGVCIGAAIVVIPWPIKPHAATKALPRAQQYRAPFEIYDDSFLN